MTPATRVLAGLALAFAAVATPALAQSGDPSFRLANRTAVPIAEVYVSSSGEGAWGSDHMGANVLMPGQTVVIRLPAGECVNDIKVVYATGQAQEWRQQDTCNLTDIVIQ
ncbi:hypothetical protein [Falsiroseomonas ponticola]|uniref:hypothetical protein n=1 Tax=Falsiroseomonas ponticola TaxID=2786951 RepID=UPI001931C554|nr:hypothetical protein [Roseomonas ponticola]